MLSTLELALGGAAFLAGVTGTWSPCGFSAIETLAVGDHQPRRATSIGASLTFALGALIGGAATFVTLSLLGSLAHGRGGGVGTVAALAIALLAALLELRGVRIVPQIRRQVPEPWRRRLPLAVASGLYGVLLGLGFTTFVLTFAVWALAGIAVALAAPQLGLAIGVGFGLGRAIPVMLLAPVLDLPLGGRIAESMAQRPALLRLARLADGAALALCAALLAASPALAAPPSPPTPSAPPPPPGATSIASGEDPSAAGAELAWEQPGIGGVLSANGTTLGFACRSLALGDSMLACLGDGDTITVSSRPPTTTPQLRVAAPGADKLAVDANWLVYRVPANPPAGQPVEQIVAQSIAPLGPPFVVASARPPSQLGRPALDGDTVAYDVSGGRSSQIYAFDLLALRRRLLLRDGSAQLLNPSISAGKLLYERVDDCAQQLLLGTLRVPRRARVLAQGPTQIPRDGGYGRNVILEGRTPHHCVGPLAGSYLAIASYWTTALSPTAAYLTVITSSNGSSEPQLYGVALPAGAARVHRRRRQARAPRKPAPSAARLNARRPTRDRA